MKHLIIISFSFLLLACNTNKSITETKNPKQETTSVLVPEKLPKKVKQQDPTKTTLTPDTKLSSISKTAAISKKEEKKPELKKSNYAPHQLWHELLKNYVSDTGNVNYKGIKSENVKLTTYLNNLSKIYADQSFASLSKEQKLAFWINAYNAMTVDLILRNYPIKSIKDIDKPWKQRFWKLGNKWFNLNEIEHDILRKMDEPRIHFAIVCASYSCPKLQNEAFIASKLETQLIHATKGFLSDSERNEITKDHIKISKIFQWFSKDFKQNGSLIDFLNLYTDVDISAKAKRDFKDYNWNLNE
jgi:hypothetical protein